MKLLQSQALSQTERILIKGSLKYKGKTVSQSWVIKLDKKKDTIKVYSLTKTEHDHQIETLVCYEGNPIKLNI